MAVNPMDYGPAIAALLDPPRKMPLDAGRANDAARAQLERPTAALFGDRSLSDSDMAAGCHSALWLRHDFLPESHRLSQKIGSVEGSYWHGIMHRREGDFGNAKYWFRRVGEHPVFATLAAALPDLTDDNTPARVRTFAGASDWDPAAFIDLCEAATSGAPDLRAFCDTAQAKEWDQLFTYCFERAVA